MRLSYVKSKDTELDISYIDDIITITYKIREGLPKKNIIKVSEINIILEDETSVEYYITSGNYSIALRVAWSEGDTETKQKLQVLHQ